MKYVDKYNKFIKESYGQNPSINWELIDTAKDLSLDYLDDGLTLSYSVNYNEPKYPKDKIKGYVEVLFGRYSHNMDSHIWNKWQYDEDYIFKSDGLNYIFWFTTSKKDAGVEFIKILKEIYPNEKINEKI